MQSSIASLARTSISSMDIRQCLDEQETYTKITLTPDSGVLHPDGRRVFYPGSTISGIVTFHVSSAIRAQHLKIILRSSERLEYGATGWQNNPAPTHVFAVKTHLWGLRHKEPNANKWPRLEAGTYTYPFSVELPMVNYNITYQNQSYQSFFSLQSAVVRATDSLPEFTDVYPIEFMPFVATSLHKEVHTEAKGADHVMGEIIMPETGFLAGETASFQLRLTPNGPCTHNKIVSVQAKLKQIISIGYDGYFRMERNEISTAKATAPQSLPETLSMELCIPKTALPSIAYSVHMKIIYQLYVTVHIKSNSLFRHKIKFAVPITIGTLGRGISPPRELLSYTDREVVCESGMRFKPRFLLNEQICDEDNLPAYDDCSPPTYLQALEAS
ncbi:unnamed protein product [Umbelopsis ramanniana]